MSSATTPATAAGSTAATGALSKATRTIDRVRWSASSPLMRIDARVWCGFDDVVVDHGQHRFDLGISSVDGDHRLDVFRTTVGVRAQRGRGQSRLRSLDPARTAGRNNARDLELAGATGQRLVPTTASGAGPRTRPEALSPTKWRVASPGCAWISLPATAKSASGRRPEGQLIVISRADGRIANSQRVGLRSVGFFPMPSLGDRSSPNCSFALS